MNRNTLVICTSISCLLLLSAIGYLLLIKPEPHSIKSYSNPSLETSSKEVRKAHFSEKQLLINDEITRDTVSKLKLGMTIDEAIEILGPQFSQRSSDGANFYLWKTRYASPVMLTMKDEKVSVISAPLELRRDDWPGKH